MNVALELAIHAACAVGIYLGRVLRFNSWDLAGNAHVVLRGAREALLDPWPVMLVAFTFVVTAVACEVALRLNGAALRVAGWRPPR